MKIKYVRSDETFPPLELIKPLITQTERKQARLKRPPALPAHCKPWLDAHSYGLLMRFPYQVGLSITGRKDDIPQFRMLSTKKPNIGNNIISVFATGYFGLATGYYIRTEPRFGIFFQSLPREYGSKAALVNGLVETWWYPKPLFLVFASPLPGETLIFQYWDPLCILMPVLCERIVVAEASFRERRSILQEKKDYERFLSKHAELRWTSLEGNGFSTQYKFFSKIHLKR